jgi:hypothetical protein
MFVVAGVNRKASSGKAAMLIFPLSVARTHNEFLAEILLSSLLNLAAHMIPDVNAWVISFNQSSFSQSMTTGAARRL